MIHFPAYYQKGSVCIKRESATSGKQVTIPETNRENNFGFQTITTPDKMSFDSLVNGMSEVSFEVYEKFLITLHQFSQRQSSEFRESHAFKPDFAAGQNSRVPGI